MDRPIMFKGIDHFNRAVFQRINTNDRRKYYYGCTSPLFDRDATEATVLAKIDTSNLCFFGNSFGCEPEGTALPQGIRIVKKEENQ